MEHSACRAAWLRPCRHSNGRLNREWLDTRSEVSVSGQSSYQSKMAAGMLHNCAARLLTSLWAPSAMSRVGRRRMEASFPTLQRGKSMQVPQPSRRAQDMLPLRVCIQQR
jgi:hypothetical protein